MKKIQLIEFIRKRVAGLDKSSSLSNQMVAKAIGLAWSQIMYDTFRNVPTELDFYAKYFQDQDIQGSEIDLPVQIIQLPHNAYVRSLMIGGSQAVPQSMGFMNIEDSMEVGVVDKSISYTVYDGKIRLKGLSGQTKADMWVIPQFDEYELGDEISIPSSKSELLAETTVKFLTGYVKDNQLSSNEQ